MMSRGGSNHPDITQKNKGHELAKNPYDALLESEHKAHERIRELEAIFSAIADNVSVYDHEGHPVQVQHAVSNAPDVEPSYLVDYNSWPFDDQTVHLYNEHGQPLPEELWPVRRILSGEMLKNSRAVDVIVRYANGREVHLNVSGAPLRDPQGQVVGAVTITQNVTERRKMELRTQKSLDILQTLAASLVQGLDTSESLELAAGVSYAESDEDTLAYRLVEMTYRQFDCQRVGIALLDAHSQTLQPLVVTGISAEYERSWRSSIQGMDLGAFFREPLLVSRLQAGEVLALDLSLSIFRERPSYKIAAPILQDHQLIGVLLLGYGNENPQFSSYELAIVKAIAHLASLIVQYERACSERDKTLAALHSAQEDLERLQDVKSSFISTVSHEFRTALTGIQGFSEIIRDQELGSDAIKEFAVDIYSDARRLVHMINDMLDLDRMESGLLKLTVGWLDLNAIILDVVSRIRPSAPHHQFRPQLARAVPILLGDSEKLSQVMTGLLSNAIKYSPDGGEIAVRSTVEGHLLHVCIIDHGVGIPPSNLERIFGRYATIDAGFRSFDKNKELGLPIIREIIQMHGGQVWAESMPGKGSAFHFTLQFTEVR